MPLGTQIVDGCLDGGADGGTGLFGAKVFATGGHDRHHAMRLPIGVQRQPMSIADPAFALALPQRREPRGKLWDIFAKRGIQIPGAAEVRA